MSNLLWSGFIFMLLLSGCGWNGTPTRNNDFAKLTSIEIVSAVSAIPARTTTKLSVTGNFSGQFSRDITDQVVWSSDSPTVASFITSASPNRVTGLIPGTANITATVGSVTSTYKLTISPATITSLTIISAAPKINKGLSTQFTVSGVFTDSTTQDLTFDATWVSNASNVATVGDAADNKGFTKALAPGTATISASFDGASDSTLLTVTEPVLQSITLSPANPSILSLSSVSFKATGNYSDGTTADISTQVAWSSSRPDFASISSGGAAKAILQGTSSISATLSGVVGTSNLKVTGGNLTGITISPAYSRLVKDTSGRLTATGTFSNGSSRDITSLVDWSVANTSIATVSTPGGNLVWLNALALTPVLTPTVISAKSGTLTATTNLAISAPLLQYIVISPTTQDMTAGTSIRLTVAATYNDGTTQDVTAISNWISSTETTATVGNIGLDKGRVSGVAGMNGSSTISASYGGITVRAPVNVKTRTIQDLILSGSTSVSAGNQVKYSAIVNYSDGTTKDVIEDTSWTIGTSNVAILADNQNQPGQVVAVDSGSGTLTASFGGKTKIMTVSVP